MRPAPWSLSITCRTRLSLTVVSDAAMRMVTRALASPDK